MSAVARPQLRGFLKASLKRNFIIATAVSFVSTVAWRVAICDSRKARYAEFYKTYDVQKDFERMKVGGVFHSVKPDGSVGEGW
ncbi:cytochrome c oxidase subunit 6C-like [Babylonia areolata]|uniref:cytochrome c oxidase subunit 6C-like n=1 Tax=Babylonia areolata TaxID=304850 RepID=UPI003FD36E48